MNLGKSRSINGSEGARIRGKNTVKEHGGTWQRVRAGLARGQEGEGDVSIVSEWQLERGG